MKKLSLVGLGLTAFALVSCNKYEFSHQTGPACQGSNQTCITQNGVDYFDYDITIPETDTRTDILFVDDNSGSMAQEQSNMASRFNNFLSRVDALDWRIGIVTTDMGGPGGNAPASSKNGTLLQFPSGRFFLSKGDPNDLSHFQNTIQRTGETGSGDERGIFAALKNLQRRGDWGFIRESIRNLAIVILSDENERSDGGTVNGQWVGLESGNDYPDDLINYVRNTWSGQKSLTVHTITVKSDPNDQACLDAQRAQSGSQAQFGTYYEELRKKTGGVKGSVCEPDYGAQLDQIGRVIVDTTGAIELACTPMNDAGGNSTLDVRTPNGYTWDSSGNKVTFHPALQPGVVIHVKYQCVSKQ